jgi:aldose sugar dehydrogenase
MNWAIRQSLQTAWRTLRADWVAVPRSVRSRFAWTLTAAWVAALVVTFAAALLLRGERGQRLQEWETELLGRLVEVIPLGYSMAVFFESPGNGVIILPLTLLATLALIRRRRPVEAVAVLASSLLAAVVVGVGWTTWPRERPDFLYSGLPSSGMSAFPSGHAAISVPFYGLLTFLWLRNSSSPAERVFGVSLLLLLIVMVLAARLVLSGHWPSDVVAGVVIGIFWLSAIVHALRRSASVYRQEREMNRSSPALVCLLVLAAGCSGTYSGDTLADTLPASAGPVQPAAAPADHEYRIVPVAEGLVHPWSIAFLPNGDMLVTERPGRLRIVRNGRLLPDPVEGVPEVRARGQGGLLEVMPHPDYASNQLIYLTYSKPGPEPNQATTALARGRFDGTRLTDVQDIFVAQAMSTAGQHFGSKLAFDGRGYLFMSIGDRGAPPLAATVRQHPAQNPGNHQGTIIRLHDDGRVPADNPLVNRGDALPEIWSYGHRNPQGMAIHPETGDLWSNEHGPRGGDELNLVLPGRNYGWPVVGFGINYSGDVIHEAPRAEGMEDPVHHWTPSIATSGLMIYTGDHFPGWRGQFFTGALAGQHVSRIVMDGRRVVSEARMLEGQGRVRDVRQGPDGFIYVAIDDRGGQTTSVLRLEPVH